MNQSPIDFDEASREWRKNKVSLGKGFFQYKCAFPRCNECVYAYTTRHKLFVQFASDFDIQHQHHPKKDVYCEQHLLCEDAN